MQETSQIRWLMYCKSAICKSGQFKFDSVINWKPVAVEVMARNEVPSVQYVRGYIYQGSKLTFSGSGPPDHQP